MCIIGLKIHGRYRDSGGTAGFMSNYTISPVYNLSFYSFHFRCKELGVNALHIKLRATGGTRTKTPGPGAQSALRALARSGMKIGRIGKSASLAYIPPLSDKIL